MEDYNINFQEILDNLTISTAGSGTRGHKRTPKALKLPTGKVKNN